MARAGARSYKALSALLTYPTAELQGASGEIRAVLHQERLVPGHALSGLDRLIAELASRDLYELQERYGLLFDRSRSLSLHLFEHVHGESRDRGQAMVDLAAHYERHGYWIRANELPDFLPLFLEFLSVLPRDEAHGLLQQPLPVLEALEERLRRRGSVYVAVFVALLAIAGSKGASVPLATATDDDPGDLEALDAAWEEAAVTFGPGGPGGLEGFAGADDACGKSRLVTRIRAAIRSVHDRSA